jgi:Na+/melibiose symporter-like transporter
VGLIISTLVFGLILKQMVFPQNYQVVFLMAFLFTLISQLHVMRVRIINPAPVAAPTRDNNMLALWRTPGFLKMALVIAAGFITFTSIIAVTPLYLVKGMGADEGFQAFFGVVELAAGITAATFVDRIIARYGNRSVIALMLAGTAVAAVIFAFAPSLNFMLIGAAVSGMTWTAGYQQIVGLSTFIGPLLGSTLANSGVNLVIVLLFGAALRLGAAVLIHYNVVSFFRAHVHLPKLASVK